MTKENPAQNITGYHETNQLCVKLHHQENKALKSKKHKNCLQAAKQCMCNFKIQYRKLQKLIQI